MMKAAQAHDGFSQSLGTLQSLLSNDQSKARKNDEVMDLPFAKVREDPKQPRTEFDEEFLAWLADDIRRRGVKSPISVRPGSNGVYVLNHGACRLRASRMAGKTTIPAILDTDYDPYDQVSENIKRKSLSARDIGRWIQGRILDGDSREDVAKRLDVDPSYITRHLSILDVPPKIMAMLYETGICCDVESLYELHLCNKQNPDETLKLCQNIAADGKITVKEIRAFKKTLKQKQPVGPNASERPNEQKSGPTGQNDGQNASPPATERKTGGNGVSDRIRNPVVMVTHGQETAVLLIFKRPEGTGRVWIDYGGGRVAQVPSSEVRIESIQERV